jgi:uncharacterized protein YodC (DUF2158 family)
MPNEQAFAAGSVVQLKSGGLKMTVREMIDGKVTCDYATRTNIKKLTLESEQLVLDSDLCGLLAEDEFAGASDERVARDALRLLIKWAPQLPKLDFLDGMSIDEIKEFIPANLTFNLRYPGVGAQRRNSPGFGTKAVPCFASGVGDRLVIGVQAMG